MTKLVEWLLAAGLILGIWSAFLYKIVYFSFLDQIWPLVLYFPLIAIGLFGLYAISVILYRVYTFNDCEEAAKELKQHIQEAREDLKKKGFIFEEEIIIATNSCTVFSTRKMRRPNPTISTSVAVPRLYAVKQ